MKIVLVTMQLGGSYRHGTEHYVGSLRTSLDARGHEVVCLAGDPRGERGRLALGGAVGGAAEILHYPSHGWMAVRGLAPSRLEPILETLAPDLVHLASPAHIGVGIALACGKLGIPWVVTMMDYWWICPRGTLLRDGRDSCDATPQGRTCLRCMFAGHPERSLRGVARRAPPALPIDAALLLAATLARGAAPTEAARWLRRRGYLVRLLDEAARVLFPSPATRDEILPYLRHDRWDEIPYGLEDAWFASPRRDAPRARGSALCVGFVGSLQPHKGPDLLLTAATRLGWNLTPIRIAGAADDPAYFDELRRLARGLDVAFEGPLSAAEVQRFLRSIDVLVVASRWPENLPFVLLEAQAARVPVIASNVAGISHRIRDSRMLFQAGSADDLARALREFQACPSAFPVPPVSTLEDMTRATEAAYRKALEHRAPATSQR